MYSISRLQILLADKEFGGFNTKVTREQEQSAKPSTRAIYTPDSHDDSIDGGTETYTAMWTTNSCHQK